MSRFIVHIDGELTHQQQCALAVKVGQAIGLCSPEGLAGEPTPGFRWEYQQDNPRPTTREVVRDAMGLGEERS